MEAGIETLFEVVEGDLIPLPETLEALYGSIYMPETAPPHILCNFVTTIDGVVSLNQPGHMGTGEISGFNAPDRMIMGLLRALSDAVIAGASTLRAPPGHIWTPDFIYPPLANAYQTLRQRLGKSRQPVNVVVTGSGNVDLSLPLFQSGSVPVMILTTETGARLLARQPAPGGLHIVPLQSDGDLSPELIIGSIKDIYPVETVLVEGGPHMTTSFFAAGLLDELFLTIAPQIAGRTEANARPGLTEGKLFAPDAPLWGKLSSLRRAGDHLFLRYRFR